jgi:hypothetical protein
MRWKVEAEGGGERRKVESGRWKVEGGRRNPEAFRPLLRDTTFMQPHVKRRRAAKGAGGVDFEDKRNRLRESGRATALLAPIRTARISSSLTSQRGRKRG